MEKIFQSLPHALQNLLISIYNIKEYRKRCGGKYKFYRNQYYNNRGLVLGQLEKVQKERFIEFVQKAKAKSTFYKKLLEGKSISLEKIRELPIVDKELLRKNLLDAYTIPKKKAIPFKTGGTTGKSLEVYYTPENMQERFAILDEFRSRFGYELGKKTAWFSGKNLLTQRDIRINRFWKTDHWYKVRYYSTFHIKKGYLESTPDGKLKKPQMEISVAFLFCYL
jgi:phenylacetate-CoA ligase